MTAKPDGNGWMPRRPGLRSQTASTGVWERTDGPGRPTGRPRPPDPEHSPAPRRPRSRTYGGQT